MDGLLQIPRANILGAASQYLTHSSGFPSQRTTHTLVDHPIPERSPDLGLLFTPLLFHAQQDNYSQDHGVFPSIDR